MKSGMTFVPGLRAFGLLLLLDCNQQGVTGLHFQKTFKSSLSTKQLPACPQRRALHLVTVIQQQQLLQQSVAVAHTTRWSHVRCGSLQSAVDDSQDQDAATRTTQVDVAALSKYAAAMAIQMGLIGALFFGLDKLVAATKIQVPFAVNCILFYVMALKSRVFNPLCNSRPKMKTKEIANAQQRVMPSWTPPGLIFPIVWLLLIGPLRAYTTSLIYATTGHYATPAIFALMLHLSIGDIWNTINNVERRYGASVLGIVCVYLSAAFAAKQYYKVLPLAGQLLSLKLIWLTMASSLIIGTWRLNPVHGKPDSLLPRVGDKTTKLIWFEK